MDRDDIEEFHCIQPIANLPSICESGILCHNAAQSVEHEDISNQAVQDLRRARTVRQGDGTTKPLHDFANVFFDARNSMLYDRQHLHEDLCVLRLRADLLDHPGAFVADGNAASKYTRIEPAPGGVEFVEKERTYARYWTHPDPPVYYERKRRRGAELLIPDCVPAEYIFGVYVSCETAKGKCGAIPWPVAINADLFFQ